MAGYHLTSIPKGELGKPSKIIEEYKEWFDAHCQGCKVMELVELSDLLGAIDSYVQQNYQLTLQDLEIMSAITQRAFKEGTRK